MEFGVPVFITELYEPAHTSTFPSSEAVSTSASAFGFDSSPENQRQLHQNELNTEQEEAGRSNTLEHTVDLRWVGKTVRIIAIAKDYSPVDQIAIFQDPTIDFSNSDTNINANANKNGRDSLSVKTELLVAGQISVGCLYMIIGPLVRFDFVSSNSSTNSEGEVVLEARTVCNVSGLDVHSYEFATRAMRKNLGLLG